MTCVCSHPCVYLTGKREVIKDKKGRNIGEVYEYKCGKIYWGFLHYEKHLRAEGFDTKQAAIYGLEEGHDEWLGEFEEAFADAKRTAKVWGIK